MSPRDLDLSTESFIFQLYDLGKFTSLNLVSSPRNGDNDGTSEGYCEALRREQEILERAR